MKNRMHWFRIVAACSLSMALVSCGGRPQQATTDKASVEDAEKSAKFLGVSRLEGVSMELVQKEPKLTAAYDNIALAPLETSAQLDADYPVAATQFESGMLSHLKSKNLYKRVESIDANGSVTGFKGNTLIVNTEVADMRIVSTGARIWGGAFAGSSYMDVYVKLTDAATSKVVHEKVISSHNNAFAASWVISTDSSLPMDMGMILGEYLAAVVPAK